MQNITQKRTGLETMHNYGTWFSITEAEAAKPPTKQDYVETKRLLKDFCVHMNAIPSFRSRNELERWRTQAIMMKLT